MLIPIKQLKTGFTMPVFGLGTFGMGGCRERDPANDDAADIAAIHGALSAGVMHIDTAESYADGYAETLVGKAISGYDRSAIFLVSKVKEANLGYDDMIAACKHSLERLGTTYLDLYLLHRYTANVPLKDSIRALDALVSQGLVKNIGVSNFTKEHVAEAQSYTQNKIVCNQVHYSLISRQPERTGLLAWCQQNDVFLTAYKPVERGAILENAPPILKALAEKYQKTPAQIAINWLVAQPNVVTIAKTRSIEHLNENLGAVGWQMDAADVERLRDEYPNQ